ncbi:hypothetical protein [Nitrospira lenta]|uniref:hypothetical protein n=1 Tax=Nitrospira lenta TaxID=1436998 RepID=UPI000EFD3B28|nr:hypothetical protein [Nitrospira lenta]
MKTTMERTVENNLLDDIRKEYGHNISHIPCAFCGEPANLHDADVIVEMHGPHAAPDHSKDIWHRSCFEDFLDQGEET